MDLVKQFEELAREIGGELHVPSLAWKYSWIRMLFGWSMAKRVIHLFRRLKWAVVRSFDKVLFIIECRNGHPDLKQTP
jgi:hypothetical protein